MNAQQKIWIVFLTHIYYAIEKKIKFHFDKESIDFLTPVIKMWDEFGPMIILNWRHGGDGINLEEESLLCAKYNSYTPNDVFIKLFGLSMQQAYCRALYMCMCNINYKVEGGGLFFFSDNKNFHFKDEFIKPFFAEHIGKINQKRFEDSFDKDFLAFFEEHIGLDFSMAENFFEVYLKSKLNVKVEV